MEKEERKIGTIQARKLLPEKLSRINESDLDRIIDILYQLATAFLDKKR